MKLLNSILLLAFALSLGCSPLKKYEHTRERFNDDVKKLLVLEDYKKWDDYYLFVGSSSIRRWDNIAQDMHPFRSVKRGYGGAHFYDLIHFTESLVAPHQRAKALLCFVGNDISGAETDLSPNQAFRLFKFFKKQVHGLFPDLPIYFIEITPTPARWNVWSQISSFNTKVRTYASSHPKVKFISTQSQFLGDNGRPIPRLYMSDSLHLSEDGYEVWSKAIKQNLTKNDL